MQKLILFFIFLFTTQLQAQQFSVSTNYTTMQGHSHEEVVPMVTLKNKQNRAVQLRWERVRSNVPDGWELVVCDKQCYSTLVDRKTFTLKPKETLNDFRVAFRPNGIDGIGTVELKVYEVNNPSNSKIIMFSASAQNSSFLKSTTAQKTELSVYPNPAIEYVMIQDNNQSVKYLEVYNVVGRKIMDFPVRHEREKYDISKLPRGMYMIRLLDQNRSILRTQRISKYNP